jgi:hypothetical protein
MNKDWRVAVDLESGKDFQERFASQEAALDRAREIVDSAYVVTQDPKHGTEGRKKTVFYPIRNVKCVTVDHDPDPKEG